MPQYQMNLSEVTENRMEVHSLMTQTSCPSLDTHSSISQLSIPPLLKLYFVLTYFFLALQLAHDGVELRVMQIISLNFEVMKLLMVSFGFR